MPDSPPDYYNRLLEQRRAEYASKGLSRMPPDFLTSTARYLSALREVLERDTRENPTSKKVEMTRTTYQRALASARDVLEARLAKISHQAAQHVNLGGEIANLLPEERALFDALVRELSSFRRSSASFLDSNAAPTAPPETPAATAAPASRAEPSPPVPARATSPSHVQASTSHASPPAEGSAPASPAGQLPGVVVRVLQDRPALALPSETLDMRKEDLMVLSSEKAQLLVQAKIAQKIDFRAPASVT